MQLRKLKITKNSFCSINSQLGDLFGNFTNKGYTDFRRENPFD